MQLKAMIIDDEAYAVTLLEALLNQLFKNVQVAGTANNAIDGIKEIHRIKPHIVFLDINMPGIDGLEMLELLNARDFKVIITSAHEHHALRALKNKVDDFLVKPINIEELEKLVFSLTEEFTRHTEKEKDWIRLVDRNETVFVKPDQIRYIRAEGRYSEVFTIDKKYVVTKNIGEFENELDRKLFFRVHRSYLVNCRFVKHISHQNGGFITLDDGFEIEISRRKKTEFISFMQP